MQADEDVGKIAMAVPVLVSKALELFLQDLCDRTYDITLSRGAKTVNALHLKHCIQSYNVFDFLREVVSKVPDYGHSDTGAEVPKRRKIATDELNDSDDECKRSRMDSDYLDIVHSFHWTSYVFPCREYAILDTADEDFKNLYDIVKLTCSENSIVTSEHTSIQNPDVGISKENCFESKDSPRPDANVTDGDKPSVKDVNLNANIDETADKSVTPVAAAAAPAAPVDVTDEPSVLTEIDRMAVDPLHLQAQKNEEERLLHLKSSAFSSSFRF
nr:dr1-associated corepressor-like [Ipomoea batatas]